MIQPHSTSSELTNRKLSVLAALLDRRGMSGPSAGAASIPRRAAGDAVPLSIAQQQLWFINQLVPGTPAYNVLLVFDLAGPMNAAALDAGLEQLVGRHAALRTTIQLTDAGPVQRVATAVESPLRRLDLSMLERTERKARLEQLTDAEVRRPIDQARGPLFRATLVHLGDARHRLILVMAHVISDGWSCSILLRELSELYAAQIADGPANLPELPIEYADYSIWQHQQFADGAFASQMKYWREQLRGAPDSLELPFDRSQPANASLQGSVESIELPPELVAALQALGAERHASLFMTLLAAFKVLLYRYTGQTDLSVGAPVAGRGRAELENLVGYFVNTVVLRTDVSGEPTFRQLLERVRETVLAAFTHQDLPFGKLVEELHPQRSAGGNPLFQVAFSHQAALGEGAWQSALRLPGITATALRYDTSTAKFALSFDVDERPDGVFVVAEYSTDVFDAATIQRLLANFTTLLSSIVAAPDQSIGRLPLVNGAERQRLLVEWNDTTVEYPQDRLIHQYFEDQAARTPDAIALVCGDRELTYRELNERANQWAHLLRDCGVGPDVLVAICLERSLEMVVSLLAVLKAGGAYLPLDPTYPSERLAHMLRDSAASVLLTQSSLRAALPATETATISIDAEPRLKRQSTANPAVENESTHLAYVIYTSGSTGQSKGALIEHRSLVNVLLAWESNYQLSSRRAWLQMANFSFDVFTADWMRALCFGAKLVLCPRADLLDAARLYRLLRDANVDSADFVPAILRNLADYLERSRARLPAIRLVLCGADSWFAHDYRRFASLLGRQCRLVNGYGLTETTIENTHFESTDFTFAADRMVPIGRPYFNTQLYVLDSARQLLPIGVAGELYIGGDSLARGYLNRPELTAERFVPHPFATDPAARLYRTGDRVRYLPDGNVEFLGRIDHQIKIRGYRIELGEIETALCGDPMVERAVVLVREDEPGDKRLAAYVVPQPAAKLNLAAIRQRLHEKLPSYMVPTALMAIDAIPLSPNGKVDRQALPIPDSAPDTGRDLVAPATDVERRLVQLWQSLLRVDSVGVRDNFFEMGGHSLLAVQLAARVEQQFSYALPVADVFQSPTIEQLAAVIESHAPSPRVEPAFAFRREGSKPPLFFLPLIDGYAFYLQSLVEHIDPDWPIYCLQPTALGGDTPPHESIEEMAAAYIVEMRRIQPQGPYHLCGYCFAGIPAYEVARQLRAAGEEIGLLVLVDSVVPHAMRPHGIVRRSWGHLRKLLRLSALESLRYAGERLYGLGRRLIGQGAPPEKRWDAKDELKSSILRTIARIEQASQHALDTYRPRPYVGNVVLIQADRDSDRDFFNYAPLLGWGELVKGNIVSHEMTFDHNQFFEEPHVRALAESLNRCLSDSKSPPEPVAAPSRSATMWNLVWRLALYSHFEAEFL